LPAPPRSSYGRIRPLPAVLGLVVLGLLMGRKSSTGIARLGRLYGAPLAHALGLPAKSMHSVLLRTLEPDALKAALSHRVRSRLPLMAAHRERRV
jgi:hypothetical protein